MHHGPLQRLFVLAAIAALASASVFASERYDTWIQGDTIRLAKGQTALIMFVSPDCQVRMTRPNGRSFVLKLEPTAKVVPPQGEVYDQAGGYIREEHPAVAQITSLSTPIALVGPAIFTLENSSGPKRTTCYVSVMITATEF
jgi:hypothetical protein